VKGIKSIQIILFILFVLNSVVGYSQPDISQLPLKKLVKFAQNAEARGDQYTAIKYYQAYANRDTSNMEVINKLAALYRDTRDYTRAATYFGISYNLEPNLNVTSLYWQGAMLKQAGRYDDASVKFNEFKKVYKGRDYATRLTNQMDGLKLAKQKSSNSTMVDIKHLDNTINKAHAESSPMVLDNNTLVFGSLSSDTMPYYLPNEELVAMPVRKLYYAKRTKDIEWTMQGVVESPLNTTDAHTVNPVISADGNRMYLTRCKTDWQGKVRCEIYQSKRDSTGKWQNPSRLGFPVNTEETSSSMPALGLEIKKNVKREVLYFASNRMAKSEGGWDIWYSVFDEKDSSFNNIENAGRKINTPGNEITPYYDSKNKTLYFSSDYHPGFGGHDIFKAKGEQKKFATPVNMGTPYNSTADDLYFALNPKQKAEGFFVSNREGGYNLQNPTCCDDIYSFYNKDYIELSVSGRVFYGGTNKHPKTTTDDPLDEAIVQLCVPVKDDNSEALMLIEADTTNENGEYKFDVEKGEDYRIVYKKDGYFYKQQDVSTRNKTRSENIPLANIWLEEITLEPVVFYIYYEFDKDEVTDSAKKIIDSTMFEVLSETPDIIVEISAHTDNFGDSIYNVKLSQRRAENVVNYLISKGIEAGRLISRGYGEDKPIATNDTEEGRALNRRTEFKVVGSVDPFSKLNVSKLRIINKPAPKEQPEPQPVKPGKPGQPAKKPVTPASKPMPKPVAAPVTTLPAKSTAPVTTTPAAAPKAPAQPAAVTTQPVK